MTDLMTEWADFFSFTEDNKQMQTPQTHINSNISKLVRVEIIHIYLAHPCTAKLFFMCNPLLKHNYLKIKLWESKMVIRASHVWSMYECYDECSQTLHSVIIHLQIVIEKDYYGSFACKVKSCNSHRFVKIIPTLLAELSWGLVVYSILITDVKNILGTWHLLSARGGWVEIWINSKKFYRPLHLEWIFFTDPHKVHNKHLRDLTKDSSNNFHRPPSVSSFLYDIDWMTFGSSCYFS